MASLCALYHIIFVKRPQFPIIPYWKFFVHIISSLSPSLSLLIFISQFFLFSSLCVIFRLCIGRLLCVHCQFARFFILFSLLLCIRAWLFILSFSISHLNCYLGPNQSSHSSFVRAIDFFAMISSIFNMNLHNFLNK